MQVADIGMSKTSKFWVGTDMWTKGGEFLGE